MIEEENNFDKRRGQEAGKRDKPRMARQGANDHNTELEDYH